MATFPLCVPLKGQRVYLIGNGSEIRDRKEKLSPFEPIFVEKSDFTYQDAESRPAMVLVGDLPADRAEAISRLCREQGIMVNVADQPALCSFYFPALILRGDLTVAISTNGKCPAAAAWLRQTMEAALPDRTEEILDWLAENRAVLRRQGITCAAAAEAFRMGRPLNEEEWNRLL